MMKRKFLPFLLLLSFTAFGKTYTPANWYSCQTLGDGPKYELFFAPANAQGLPAFTYSIQGRTPQARIGTQVVTNKTSAGTWVSVTHQRIFDGPFTDLSMLVPQVNLDLENDEMIRFSTILLETTLHNRIGGPETVRGVVQESKTTKLTCVAEFINF